jgi:hypothetical protein
VRFDRALRSARAKLVKAFDDINVATAQQREKLRAARDRLEEAIAMQDDCGSGACIAEACPTRARLAMIGRSA